MAQLIKTRRSIRNFKQENLDKNQIQDLLSTTAYAPTSQNDNTVMLTVVDNKVDLSNLGTSWKIIIPE